MQFSEASCPFLVSLAPHFQTCWLCLPLNILQATGYVMHHQFSTTVRSAHTVFMCFVFI